MKQKQRLWLATKLSATKNVTKPKTVTGIICVMLMIRSGIDLY